MTAGLEGCIGIATSRSRDRVWTASDRARTAHLLLRELDQLASVEATERAAIAIDNGFGLAAIAAVAARPAGIARAHEAALWARLAYERGISVATVMSPDTSDDLLDAFTELHYQLILLEERAA